MKINEIMPSDPLGMEERSLVVDMNPYDYYRLGIALAAKDEMKKPSGEKEKIITCYSPQEYEELKKVLQSKNIPFTEI